MQEIILDEQIARELESFCSCTVVCTVKKQKCLYFKTHKQEEKFYGSEFHELCWLYFGNVMQKNWVKKKEKLYIGTTAK